jgi:hypothetical protein
MRTNARADLPRRCPMSVAKFSQTAKILPNTRYGLFMEHVVSCAVLGALR